MLKATVRLIFKEVFNFLCSFFCMLACCFIPFVMQGVMHVQVVAMVTKPEQVRSDESNAFHLIFNTKLDVECATSQPGRSAPSKLKRVLPGTREEAMSILQFAPQDELETV